MPNGDNANMNPTNTSFLDLHLESTLRELLSDHVCIVGVGNRLRGDDGAGPTVIDQRGANTRGTWIDAGVTPENYLETIARANPVTILIVDAVDFGGSPGECRLLDPADVETLVISTHAGSLSMIADYMSARVGAEFRVLGIQPKTINIHEALSDPVTQSVRELAAMLSDLLSCSAGNS